MACWPDEQLKSARNQGSNRSITDIGSQPCQKKTRPFFLSVLTPGNMIASCLCGDWRILWSVPVTLSRLANDPTSCLRGGLNGRPRYVLEGPSNFNVHNIHNTVTLWFWGLGVSYLELGLPGVHGLSLFIPRIPTEKKKFLRSVRDSEEGICIFRFE
jgi:hypothetical protein